ncbi:MAG: hypothetical protein ABIL58_25505 [Pseudomonadota bacterium]
MQRREGNLCDRCVKRANSYPGVYLEKRYAGPGRKGRPDITGAIHGRRVELEAKIDDNTPTPIQKHWLKVWKDCGALAAAFWTDAEFNALVMPLIVSGGNIASMLRLDDNWRPTAGYTDWYEGVFLKEAA